MSRIVQSVLHYCNVSLASCSPISEGEIPYYDLTFVLEGEMVYFANGERIHLKRNDVVFMPPGTCRARQRGMETVRYVSFNFQITTGKTLDLPCLIAGGVSQEIRNAVMNYPFHHLAPNHFSSEKCIALLDYILYCLLDETMKLTRNEHVSAMIAYVDSHISQKLTLRQVSAKVGLSREYASALFRREMNCTLTDYINEQKLTLALAMILGEELSLTQISEDLGFDNYNYFSRLFKKKFGMTPIQVKKEKIIPLSQT